MGAWEHGSMGAWEHGTIGAGAIDIWLGLRGKDWSFGYCICMDVFKVASVVVWEVELMSRLLSLKRL